MIVRATTTPGLEDVALEEGERLLGESGFTVSTRYERLSDFVGAAHGDPSDAGVTDVSYIGWQIDGVRSDYPPFAAIAGSRLRRGARSIYHLTVHVGVLNWHGDLDSLVEATLRIDYPELSEVARRGGRFRVTCHRSGSHAFQSPDVERAVGGALFNRYGCAVDLERPDLNVAVDVVGPTAVVGYQLSGRKGMDRRHDWRFHPRITLRTPVAYGMLRLAGYTKQPGPLMDPFCGAGTILLEAGGIANDIGVPVPALRASDREPAAVHGTTENLRAAGLSADVAQIDVHELKANVEADSLDYVVTDPPFGVRLGRKIDYHFLYQSLLAGAAYGLRSGGRLVLLVDHRRGVFDAVASGFRAFEPTHARRVTIGGLSPELIVLRRA